MWRGGLSVRRVCALLQYLPPEAAAWHALGMTPAVGWGLEGYLLADVFHALTGSEHPARPKKPKAVSPGVTARLLAQEARLARERSGNG
jgi:hypothetical protein